MIIPSHYDHGLFYKMREATCGNFSIEKSAAKKGSIVQTYSPLGYFYMDKMAEDFPVVKLVDKDGTWMSDTPMEQEGLKLPVQLARGNVLIFGLGLGLYPHLLLKHNKGISSVTIVEMERDVVALVAPTLGKRTHSKVQIVMNDAESYIANNIKSGVKFDFIYIDIWPDEITPIKEIDMWLAKVKPLLSPLGHARCWLQELYDRVKSMLPKAPLPRDKVGQPQLYPPCLICGKRFRYDYLGLCMDCADSLGVSELYAHKESSWRAPNLVL